MSKQLGAYLVGAFLVMIGVANSARTGPQEPVVTSVEIRASRMGFSALAAGPPEGEMVFLLHGFPQTSHAFRGQPRALAAAGFHAVAPDQRGYSRKARPEGVDAYRVGKLIDDVAAMADALGAKKFHLVGHDWGGAVAWGVASRYPERLLSLTVLSTPHPRALALASAQSDQSQRSSYMARFAAEDAEAQFLANRAAVLRSLLPSPPIAAADREVYVAALGTPEALRGALNWYRALLQSTASPAAAANPAPPPRSLRVPTLYIYGAEDPVFSPDAARATAQFVSGPYEFRELAGVGHWALESKPQEVSALLMAHLARNASPPAVSTLQLDAELPSRGRLGGVSVDLQGNIYVSNFSASVWRIDPAGHVQPLPLRLQGSSGNAIDRSGNLYQSSFVDGRIVRMAPEGAVEDYVSQGLEGPVGVSVAPDGTLYVCNCRGNYVARVGKDRQVERWGASPDLDCPNGITLDAADGLPVVVSFNNGHVLKFSSDGTARRIASLPGKNAHIAATATAFYVTQIEANRVYRITRDGQASPFAGSGELGLEDGPLRAAKLARPNGIAVAPDGAWLLINNLDGAWRGDQPTRIVLRRIALP